LLGAGTFINPLLKIVTVVAVLAATYFFILEPVLDTAEDEIDRAANRQEQAFRESEQRSRQMDLQFSRSQATSYAQGLRAGSQPWHEAADEVLSCVRDAGDDPARMERCANFGEVVTSETLSDRNFATSYADSLDAQGNTADAERVRDCVADAGYKPAPMQRCYDLADQLLFG
jgi:hypothetical protein